MMKNDGFTLLELLVVLLIMSIIASMALLAFGDFGAERQVRANAEQFAAYIKFMQQKAILEKSTLGIKIDDHRYEALRYDHRLSWTKLLTTNAVNQHNFAKKVQVNFNNQPANFSQSPQIIITPDGSFTNFTINFGTSSAANILSLTGKPNGTLVIMNHAL